MGEKAYKVLVVFGYGASPARMLMTDGTIRLIDGVEFVDLGSSLSSFDNGWHCTQAAAWAAAAATLETQARCLLEQAAELRRKEGLDAVCASA